MLRGGLTTRWYGRPKGWRALGCLNRAAFHVTGVLVNQAGGIIKMLPLPRYVTSFIITANSQKPAPALGRAGIGSLASASLRTVDAARDTRPHPPEVQLRAARRVRPSLLPFCDQGNCVTPTPESLRFSQHRDRPHNNVAQHLIASSISTRATAPSSVCSSTRARFCAPPGAGKPVPLVAKDSARLLPATAPGVCIARSTPPTPRPRRLGARA